jgi:hypothetical protein
VVSGKLKLPGMGSCLQLPNNNARSYPYCRIIVVSGRYDSKKCWNPMAVKPELKLTRPSVDARFGAREVDEKGESKATSYC